MADPKPSPPRPAADKRHTPRRQLRLVDPAPAAAGDRLPSARRSDPTSRAARRRLILDTLAAIARSGQTVTAARICVSGDILLLTGNQMPQPDEAPADLDWVSLAGQT